MPKALAMCRTPLKYLRPAMSCLISSLCHRVHSSKPCCKINESKYCDFSLPDCGRERFKKRQGCIRHACTSSNQCGHQRLVSCHCDTELRRVVQVQPYHKLPEIRSIISHLASHKRFHNYDLFLLLNFYSKALACVLF